ncbi:MAG: hypothetical protein AAGA96_00970 [Verrucomicrobiota bacterium]
MVAILHRAGLTLFCLTLPVLFSQCKTKRTYGEVREGSIQFDEAMWGGQGNADSEEIRNKFANRGYTLDEEGNVVADKPNLYSGETARETGSAFSKKEARLRRDDANTKEFKTPEYLKRQQREEFAVTEAREATNKAREGNFENQRDRQSGRLFKRNSESTTELASFNTSEYRDADSSFDTSQNRQGTRAIENAPDAQGTDFKAGYQDNAAMSLDDVKKMLNPGVYAQGKKLE